MEDPEMMEISHDKAVIVEGNETKGDPTTSPDMGVPLGDPEWQSTCMKGMIEKGAGLPLKNVVPESRKIMEYDRPCDESPTGRPEHIAGKRFSLFIDDPAVIDSVSWSELVVSHDGIFFHGPNLLIDDDTLRVLDGLNVMRVSPDEIFCLHTAWLRSSVFVRCHNCGVTISQFLVSDEGSAERDKDVFVCEGCGFARYCGDTCAARAWVLGHHLTCPCIRRMINSRIDDKSK